MSRPTLILIIVLSLITAMLLYLALVAEYSGRKNTTKTPLTPPPSLNHAQETSIFFEPPIVSLYPNSSSSSSVMIDSAGHHVTAVQLEMTFDPALIEKITLKPPPPSASFFDPSSPVLFQKVDYTTGRISYAVGIAPNQAPRIGKGTVVAISITAKPGARQTKKSSTITFVKQTLVTEEGSEKSILKHTSPLTITF